MVSISNAQQSQSQQSGSCQPTLSSPRINSFATAREKLKATVSKPIFQQQQQQLQQNMNKMSGIVFTNAIQLQPQTQAKLSRPSSQTNTTTNPTSTQTVQRTQKIQLTPANSATIVQPGDKSVALIAYYITPIHKQLMMMRTSYKYSQFSTDKRILSLC